MDMSEWDTETLLTADKLLHQLKSQHSYPPGNPLFRLLHEMALPVCNEVERRTDHA